ncbi:hypothetical protein D3C80_1715820 [compost metagenome]
MRGDVRLDSGDHAGRRGVNRHGAAATGGQRLTFQHPVTGFHTQLALRAEVLLKRDDKTLRQRHVAQRNVARLSLHFRRMNTAVEVPDFVFFERGKQIKHVTPHG